METLLKIWDAFNGNKTIIGLALLQLATHLPEPYQTYANLLGSILAGTGVMHKAVKIGGNVVSTNG